MANGRNDDALEIVRAMEAQLTGHERRITAIERRQRRPWEVAFWQSLAFAVLVITGLLFGVYETRLMFFPTVQASALLTVMAVALAGGCWRMADVTLERIKSPRSP